MKIKNNNGFSLIELLIAVTVLGVLAAIAAPSLSNIVEKRRVSAQSGIISSAFSVARSEALSRLRDISVCWNSTDAQIDTGDGAQIAPSTMTVYLPITSEVTEIVNGVQEVVSPEMPSEIIRSVEYTNSQIVVVDNVASNCISYNAQGRVAAGSVLLGVCKETDDSSDSHVVTITSAGRSLVQANDGNSQINCDL